MKSNSNSLVNYQLEYVDKLIKSNEAYLKALNSKNLVERIINFNQLNKLQVEFQNSFNIRPIFFELIKSDFFLCTLDESIKNYDKNKEAELSNPLSLYEDEDNYLIERPDFTSANLKYRGGNYNISLINDSIRICPVFENRDILNKAFLITDNSGIEKNDSNSLLIKESDLFSPVLRMSNFDSYLDILEVSNSPYSEQDLKNIIISMGIDISNSEKMNDTMSVIQNTLFEFYNATDFVLRALRDNYTSMGLTIENDSMKLTKEIQLGRQSKAIFNFDEFAKELYSKQYIPQKNGGNGFKVGFNYNEDTKLFSAFGPTNLIVRFFEDSEEDFQNQMIIESTKEFSVFDFLSQHKRLFDFVLLV